jgi:GR25 family glycosyltransferase involved in LPS biosynthesis
MPNDMNFAKCYAAMKAYWKEHKTELISWMDKRMKHVVDVAAEYKIAAGNTEGWGAVCWLDNPNLDWKFIKEAGLTCAELGAKHNYRFNCSSNFTHPQFKGIWDDVKWHKQVTSVIRNI